MTNKINTWFVGSDNRKSAITVYQPETIRNKQLVLFLHGFKGYKDWGTFPQIMEQLTNSGSVVVSFNFSHNGGTVESPIDFPDLLAFSNNNYLLELNDVGYMLEWMKLRKADFFQQCDVEDVCVIGHSRGGGIALLAAEKYAEIKKVVTWAAVADFEERLPNEVELKKWKNSGIHTIRNGRTMQDMPMKYSFIETLIKYSVQLNIKRAVQCLSKPLLVVHGVDDETVSIKDANRIGNWNPKAIKCFIENANHTFNGKHPWNEKVLPKESIRLVKETIEFLTT